MVVARVALGNGLVPVGRLVFETDGRRAHSTFIYGQEWIDNPRGFDLCPQMPRVEHVIGYGHVSGLWEWTKHGGHAARFLFATVSRPSRTAAFVTATR